MFSSYELNKTIYQHMDQSIFDIYTYINIYIHICVYVLYASETENIFNISFKILKLVRKNELWNNLGKLFIFNFIIYSCIWTVLFISKLYIYVRARTFYWICNIFLESKCKNQHSFLTIKNRNWSYFEQVSTLILRHIIFIFCKKMPNSYVY